MGSGEGGNAGKGRCCRLPVAIGLALVLLCARVSAAGAVEGAGADPGKQSGPEPYTTLESLFTLYQP